MLSTNIKTTSDLMSIALQAEREAIQRYTLLAAKMRAADNKSVAALFERMAIEEQKHERLLLEWMAQEGINENPETGPISWQDPNVSTTYNDEAHDPYSSSPYKALAFAVHNEEIAFRFYTHVAANSENKAVRKYAEILAREELGHAALLRAERRRAYHSERETSMAEPMLDPKAVHNEADLLSAAIYIDRYLADEMNVIGAPPPEINSLTSEIRQQIINNEHALNDKVRNIKTLPSEAITRNLEQLESYHADMKKKLNNPELRLQQLQACFDRSFAFYDAVVETTADEATMLSAQKLTSSALDRIGVLKHALADPAISD